MWWFVLLLSPCAAVLIREPGPMERLARSDPQELFLDVRVNQFMADNTDTFPMRFYFNQLSSQDSNIVIFVGGEWEISPSGAAGGLAYEIAAAIKASLFYTEHRYYGQTWPTNSTATPDLRFLTIDQALGDLAQFIEYVKSENFENGRYRYAKVVLVGCSYAGTMATWMKLSYPHLIDAAVSDGAPLHAQENFPEYLETVTKAIRAKSGDNCVNSIQLAVDQILQRLQTPNGALEISQMFNTCSTIAASVPLDVTTFFFYGIFYPIAGVIQYALPGRIETMCAGLTNTNISDPVQRLANLASTDPFWLENECFETRYTEMAAFFSNTSRDHEFSFYRSWYYQTCIEYGWFQTTTGSDHPFRDVIPLEFMQQVCKDYYSSEFDEARTSEGVKRTNLFFGARNLPDHVITAHGELDPWAPMGAGETDARPLSPVYILPEASHCRAITSTAASESEEILAIKKKIINDVYERIFQPFPSSAARMLSSVAVLMSVGVALLK